MFADDLLLFAEENLDQIECILSCLNYFWLIYGQKVSIPKTSIYFSKNVIEITRRCGFNITQDIGRYLGTYIIHGRCSRKHYDDK